MFDELVFLFTWWVLGQRINDLYHFMVLQEKAANALALASNTIRWVMGPAGTVVTFPNELGFPSIFDHKPCRYELSSSCILIKLRTYMLIFFSPV